MADMQRVKRFFVGGDLLNKMLDYSTPESQSGSKVLTHPCEVFLM